MAVDNLETVMRFRKFARDERGSISILIIGLFIAALSALMVITDLAVVATSKRALDHATEAAAMKAVRTLNEAEYYKGKHTLLTGLWESIVGGTYADNRVPIDCEKGLSEVRNEMNSWQLTNTNLKTVQIKSYKLESYRCTFDLVHLETSAVVKLPFPAPFTNLDQVDVNSSITTKNEKDKGLYLFGVRVH